MLPRILVFIHRSSSMVWSSKLMSFEIQGNSSVGQMLQAAVSLRIAFSNSVFFHAIKMSNIKCSPRSRIISRDITSNQKLHSLTPLPRHELKQSSNHFWTRSNFTQRDVVEIVDSTDSDVRFVRRLNSRPGAPCEPGWSSCNTTIGRSGDVYQGQDFPSLLQSLFHITSI